MPLSLGRPGDDGRGLGPWPLLDKHALPAFEFFAWPAQHDRDLQREDDVSVQVLVQIGVITHAVVKDQRRGLALSCGRALCRQLAVRGGEPPLAEHAGPCVSDDGQQRVELLAQLAYQAGEGSAR